MPLSATAARRAELAAQGRLGPQATHTAFTSQGAPEMLAHKTATMAVHEPGSGVKGVALEHTASGPAPTPAEVAALEEVRKQTAAVLKMTEDVHNFASDAVSATEKDVIVVASDTARALCGWAAEELERSVKSTRRHPSVMISIQILKELANSTALTDEQRATKLQTVERQLFEAPQIPSVERAIELVESARREIDIVATERALAHMAQTPGVAHAHETLLKLAAAHSAKNPGKRLSKREQLALVEQVMSSLGDETQTTEVNEARSLVEDIRKSLVHVRTTIAAENEKVALAMAELDKAPQSPEVKRAMELVGDVERRLSDPRADTKLSQRSLGSAEHLLMSMPLEARKDSHVRAALASIRAARHDEEIDEARNQLEMSLVQDHNRQMEEQLQAAHDRLALVQKHAHSGAIPKEQVAKELMSIMKALQKLPKETQTTRTDHAEEILDHIFKDIQLENDERQTLDGDGADAADKKKKKKRRRKSRLVSDSDIHDEDDRLALLAIERATAGLSPGEGGAVLGTDDARKALAAAAALIDGRRSAKDLNPQDRRRSVEETRDQISQALDSLGKGPQVPSTRKAEEELKNARDFLEHELSLLALGEGQDGTGSHSKAVTQLLSHANSAIVEARKQGDNRVQEAEELLKAAVLEADDPTSDPKMLREKIETAERLLAAAALSQTDSPKVQAAMQDISRVSELQALEAAFEQLKRGKQTELVKVAQMEVGDAIRDLQTPGRSRTAQTKNKVARAQAALKRQQEEERKSMNKAAIEAGIDPFHAHVMKVEEQQTEYAAKFLEAVSQRLHKLADKEGLENAEQLSEKDQELVYAAQLVDKIHHVKNMEDKQKYMSKLEELQLKGMTREDRAKLFRELENRLIDAEPSATTKEARTLVEMKAQHEELQQALEELHKDPHIKTDPHVQSAAKELEHVIKELEDDMRHKAQGGKSRDSPEQAELKRRQLDQARDALASAPKTASVSKAAAFVERIRNEITQPREEQTAQERQMVEAAMLIVDIAKAKTSKNLQQAEHLFAALRASGFGKMRGGTQAEREERIGVLNEIYTSLEKAAKEAPENEMRLRRMGRLVQDTIVDEKMNQASTLFKEAKGRDTPEVRALAERVDELRRRKRRRGAEGMMAPSEVSKEMTEIKSYVDALPPEAVDVPLRALVHELADHALEAAKREGSAPEEELAEAIEELNNVPDSKETRAAKEALAKVLVRIRQAEAQGGKLNRDELRTLLNDAAKQLDDDSRQHNPHVHRAQQLLDLAEAQKEIEEAISVITEAAEYSPSLKRALELLSQVRRTLDSSMRGASIKGDLIQMLSNAARRIEKCGIKNDDITNAAALVRRAMAVLRRHDDELLAERQRSLDKVEELINTLKDLPGLPVATVAQNKRTTAIQELQESVAKARTRRPGDEARHLILPAKPTTADLGLGLEIDEYQNCTNVPGHHLAGRQCVPDAVCSESTCNHHGLCSVIEGSVSCLCNPGFVTMGNRFCSTCASRSATYPDCFTRDLTDDYVRDSLGADVCTAPLLPTTLNAPGLLHTSTRTLHIQDKYFINTAVNHHAMHIVVPEESLLRVHVFAQHPDLYISERQITLKLALAEMNQVVHEGTKFFGQQESVMAAILAPRVVYALVFEYNGTMIERQSADRKDKCPTMRVDLAVTAATTLESYKDIALQDALLEAADAVHAGKDPFAPKTSIPNLGVGAGPEGVPQDVVEAIATGLAVPSHLAAQAAGHGGCSALPTVPSFPLNAQGKFEVPPAGFFQSEKLAVLTGVSGRGHVIEDGIKGSTTGPALATSHVGLGSEEHEGHAHAVPAQHAVAQVHHHRPDYDSGVENAIYMLPFEIPVVDERMAFIETDIEFDFVYGALRLMIRNEKSGMLFLAHTAVNTNRIRVPLTPGAYTLIILLLKPHPAPVPEHPTNLPHMQEAEKALATVTMPECMMYSLKFKVDFATMPEVPPGEKLTKDDILTEDCRYSLLPPHLNVPGYMGYFGKRLHLFETFKYDALRPLRFVHFEVSAPSVVRIAVPAHHNKQDVTIRLVRLDNPFEGRYDTEEQERQAREEAEDRAFAAAEAEDDRAMQEALNEANKDGKGKKKKVAGMGQVSDAIAERRHISEKKRRAAGPNAKLVSMGYISKKAKSSSIVAEVDPGSYRLDIRTPRSRVLAVTEVQCEGFTMEMTIVPETEAENMSEAQCRSSAPHAPVIPSELIVGTTVVGAKHEAPVTEVDQGPMDMASALMQSSQRMQGATDDATTLKLKQTAKAKSLQYSYVAHVPYARWHDRKPIVTWEFWVNEIPVGEKALHLELELESDFARVPLIAVLEESLDDRDKARAEAAAANAAAEAVSNAGEGRGVLTGSLRERSAAEMADDILHKNVRAEGWPALMVDRNYQVMRKMLTPGLYRLALYLLAPGRFSHMAADHRSVDEDFACVEYDLRLTVTAPSTDPMINRCLHRTPTKAGLQILPRSLNTLRFLGSDMLATQGILSGKFVMPRSLHRSMTESSLVQRIINDNSHEQQKRNPNAVSELSVSRMEIVLPSASLLRVSLDSEASPVTFKLLRHRCLARPGESFESQPLGQANHVQPWGKYDMQREMGRFAAGCVEEIVHSISGRFTVLRFLDPGLYEVVIEQGEMSVTQDAAAASDCVGYDLQVAVSALHALDSPDVLPDRIFPPEILKEEEAMHGRRKPGEYEAPKRDGAVDIWTDPDEDKEEHERERKLHPNYRPHALLAELNRASAFIPLCPNLGSDHFPPAPPKEVATFYFYDSVRRNEHLYLQQRQGQPRVYTMRFKTPHSFRIFAQVGMSILTTHLTVSLTSLGGIHHSLLEYNGLTRNNRHTVAVDVAPAGDWLLTLAEAPTPIENPDNMGVFCSYFTFKLEIEPLATPSDALIPSALGIPHAYLLVSSLQRVLPRYPQLPYTLNSPAFLVPHHTFHHFAAFSLLPMGRRTITAEHAALFGRNEMHFVLYHKTLLRMIVTPAVRHHIDAHFSVRILLDCDACDAIVVGREVTVHNTRLYSWIAGQLDPGRYTLTLVPRTAALPQTWFTSRGALDVQVEMAMAPVEHVLKSLPHPCPQILKAEYAVCQHTESIFVQRAEPPFDALSVTEEKAVCPKLQGSRVYTLTLKIKYQSTVAVSLYFDFLMTALMPTLTDIVNEHRWHGERLMNSFQLFAVVPPGYYNLTIDSLGGRVDELLNDVCLRDTYGLSVQVTRAAENAATSTSWLKSQLLAHEQLKRDAGVTRTGKREYASTVHRTGAEVTDEEKLEIWTEVAELQGKFKVEVEAQHADALPPTVATTCVDPILPQYLLPHPPQLHGTPPPPDALMLAMSGANAPRVHADSKATESGETVEEAAAIAAEQRALVLAQPLVAVHTPGSFVRLSVPVVRARPIGGRNPYDDPEREGEVGHVDGEGPMRYIKVRSKDESLLIVDVRSHGAGQRRHVDVWAVDERENRVSSNPPSGGYDMVPKMVYEFQRGQRHTKVFWLPRTYERPDPGPYQYMLEVGATFDPSEEDLENGRQAPCHAYALEVAMAPIEHLTDALIREHGCTETLPPATLPADNRGKAALAIAEGVWHSGRASKQHHTKTHRISMHVMEESLLSAQFTYPFLSASFRFVVYRVEDDGHTYEVFRARPGPVLSSASGERVEQGVHAVPLQKSVDKDTALDLHVTLRPGNYYLEVQEQLSTVVHELLSKLLLRRAAPADASPAERKLVLQEAAARASKSMCIPYTFQLELTPVFLAKEHGTRKTLIKDAPHRNNPIERGACQPFSCGCRNIDVFAHQRGPRSSSFFAAVASAAAVRADIASGVPRSLGEVQGIPMAQLPSDSEAADCTSAGICLATADMKEHAAIVCHCSEGYAGARCERCDTAKGYSGYPVCVLTPQSAQQLLDAEEFRAQAHQDGLNAVVDSTLSDKHLMQQLSMQHAVGQGQIGQSAGARLDPHQHQQRLTNEQVLADFQKKHGASGSGADLAASLFDTNHGPAGMTRPGPGSPGYVHVPPVGALPDVEYSPDHTGFSGTPLIIPTVNVHLRTRSDRNEVVPMDERIYCTRACLRGYCDYRTGRCVSTPVGMGGDDASSSSSSAAPATRTQERLEKIREETRSTFLGRIGFRFVYLLAFAAGLAVIVVLLGMARRYLQNMNARAGVIGKPLIGAGQRRGRGANGAGDDASDTDMGPSSTKAFSSSSSSSSFDSSRRSSGTTLRNNSTLSGRRGVGNSRSMYEDDRDDGSDDGNQSTANIGRILTVKERGSSASRYNV